MEINSSEFFRSHWIIWKILGVVYKHVQWKKLYLVYSLLIILLVTIAYPVHLGLSLFRSDNLPDDLNNLTVFMTTSACGFKILIYTYNFDKVQEMEKILKKLDSRISGKEEKFIYSQLKAQLRSILYTFIGIYLPIGVFAEMSLLFEDDKRLMYPAKFPFDWQSSKRNYWIANMYQFVGTLYLLMQNYVSDSYPAVMLCIISAHTKMLYKRFEKVGSEDTEDTEAQRQLEDCITDHKRLLDLFDTMESFMSMPMLIQFAVSAIGICVSMTSLIFFVSSPMEQTHILFYGLAMLIQIFPTCYYGTDTELWFGKLHYAAFSCNWTTKSRSFKKKLMLFVECSLKNITAMAGGMVRINVATFFATLKFAYSLFTVLLRMRNSI